MRIAVCDDESIFLDILCGELARRYGDSGEVCRYCDGSEILSAVESGERFDLIFLDIEMKSTDGMTAARGIRRYDGDVLIIFLTSHTEQAPEGYEVRAFRFLQKPLIPEKLTAALNDAEQLIGSRRRTIAIRDGGSEYLVSPNDIIYAQSDNNDVRFITAAGEYRSRMKFADAVELLTDGSPDFIRIHRCLVVNAAHVSSYQAAELRTDSGEILPVSRKFSDSLRAGMTGYIRRNAR